MSSRAPRPRALAAPRARSRSRSRARGASTAGAADAAEDGAIHFFGIKGPYAALSNFAPTPFVGEDGVEYPNTEIYLHVDKARAFGDADALEAILTAATPLAAKRAGRAVRDYVDATWKARREGTMLRGLRAKFAQHAGARAVLLGTGDAPLIEAAPRDYFWGAGASGRGENKLGQLLVRVRAEIRGAAAGDAAAAGDMAAAGATT